MAERFARRALLVGAAGLAAAGCDPRRPDQGLLGAARRLHDRAQGLLFREGKLAPDPGEAAVTPAAAFPRYRIGDAFPAIPAAWSLRVSGMVARPVALSLEELMRLPRTDLRVRHHCVEGWTAVASWHGVRLAELARVVGADPRAGYVELRSFELPYFSSWDRASALHPQTILAYGKDGAPLPLGHGAPLRLYAGVKLGYKLVKWLSEVRFLPAPTGGYWEDHGYEWFASV